MTDRKPPPETQTPAGRAALTEVQELKAGLAKVQVRVQGAAVVAPAAERLGSVRRRGSTSCARVLLLPYQG
jgi:hypothetical protein